MFSIDQRDLIGPYIREHRIGRFVGSVLPAVLRTILVKQVAEQIVRQVVGIEVVENLRFL